MEVIELNNNVGLNELYDGKEWIHGISKNNVDITIFIVTIQGNQLKYCLDAINNLNTNISVLVNVIMNISPTSVAYNNMITRCKTRYFIQLDEDMELYPNSIEIITNNLSSITNKCYLHYYYLVDDYLGINDPPVIIGLKVYKHEIMKNYDISKKYKNDMISSVDQLWQKSINDDGFINKQFFYPVGNHAKHRECFDIMLRYCKMTKSVLDPRIESHRSDKMKLIKPMNKIENFEIIYKLIVNEFIKLGFNTEVFNKNNKILKDFLSYIPSKNLESYGLPHNYVRIKDIDEIEEKNDDILLTDITFGPNMVNIKNLYAIIGIVNTLFENYEYSYDKYPYEIDKHFNKLFKFNLAIVFHEDVDLTQININEYVDYDVLKNKFIKLNICKQREVINENDYDLIITIDDNYNKQKVMELICGTKKVTSK